MFVRGYFQLQSLRVTVADFRGNVSEECQVLVSAGRLIDMYRGVSLLMMFAYCAEPQPIIRGDSPRTRSNESAIGCPYRSMNVNVHVAMMGRAS